MITVLLFSLLLLVGLVASQLVPPALPESAQDPYFMTVQILTQLFLAFIMFRVGLDFTIDKTRLRSYGLDYLITAGAANTPWVLVVLYMGFLLPPDAETTADAWKETLLLARFVAPTSAGVLFSMLAAANLQDSWLFSKAKVIAVFDDLDTIIWLIPLKLIITGFQWEALVVVGVMLCLLLLAWVQLHSWNLPVSWPWVMLYAAAITAACQILAWVTGGVVTGMNAIVIEVLLPAFCLGACMKEPVFASPKEEAADERVAVGISGIFLLLVGLSIPPFFSSPEAVADVNWAAVAGHVLAMTVMMNAGKMFPTFFYSEEASLRERIALGIGIWPRGEVGAGIIIVAIGLSISGLCVLVSAITLVVNLVLIGVYVIIVKRLLVSGQAADGEKAGKGDGWVKSEHGQECCSEDAARAAHHHETQNSSSKEFHHQLSPPSTRI